MNRTRLLGTRHFRLFTTLCLASSLLGCQDVSGTAAGGATPPSSKAAVEARTPDKTPAAAVAKKTPAASKVTRVVFLDKKNCCDCTKKRVDGSWTALQDALKQRAVPVERIHVDTQADAAKKYQAMKAAMVLPGLYFLDANDTLVKQLQGEVSSAQVLAALR